MVSNSVPNPTFARRGCECVCPLQPVHSQTQPSVCLLCHAAQSNTHFRCQAQIFTLSYTQTLSHSLPRCDRPRVLQSINVLPRTGLNSSTPPRCVLILHYNGAFYMQLACDLLENLFLCLKRGQNANFFIFVSIQNPDSCLLLPSCPGNRRL